MRSRMRAVGLTLALTCTLVVSGCTPPQSSPTPTPSPAATPVFTSDAEALAAATAAYKRYLAVSDSILNEGGVRPERLNAVATASVVATESASFQAASSKHLKSTGATVLRTAKLQSFTSKGDGVARVIVYACLDVSKVDVTDASGRSVVSGSRPDLISFEVTLERAARSAPLLVAAETTWNGGDICS